MTRARRIDSEKCSSCLITMHTLRWRLSVCPSRSRSEKSELEKSVQYWVTGFSHGFWVFSVFLTGGFLVALSTVTSNNRTNEYLHIIRLWSVIDVILFSFLTYFGFNHPFFVNTIIILIIRKGFIIDLIHDMFFIHDESASFDYTRAYNIVIYGWTHNMIILCSTNFSFEFC